MFWHSFKYSLKTTLRDRVQMFWSFIFIIILGTLFRATFGNAYEKSELRYDIGVVAYIEDDFIMENVSTIIENITVDEAGEKKLFNITYANSMEEAETLFDESGAGLLYSEDGELKLIVKESGIDESILSSVVSQYHQIITVMKDVADKPADMVADTAGTVADKAVDMVVDIESDIDFDTDFQPDYIVDKSAVVARKDLYPLQLLYLAEQSDYILHLPVFRKL